MIWNARLLPPRGVAMLALGVGTVAALASQPLASERLEGMALVIDGDTIAIAGVPERIRLHGIDAPESGQTCDDAQGKRYLCGTYSGDFLASIIGRNGRVSCIERDRDRYGRIVGECTTLGGTQINANMVQGGWAVAYRKYGGDAYDAQETEAKAAKRGMWQGNFMMPWDWRSGDRLQTERKADGQPEGCPIKGNISGESRVYHMPGQSHYGRTKIEPERGERWFCSEAEAQAAGWRAAKR